MQCQVKRPLPPLSKTPDPNELQAPILLWWYTMPPSSTPPYGCDATFECTCASSHFRKTMVLKFLKFTNQFESEMSLGHPVPRNMTFGPTCGVPGPQSTLLDPRLDWVGRGAYFILSYWSALDN